MNAVPAESVVMPMPELWMTLLKSVGMLCVVLGTLVAVLWLMRRLYHRGVAGQPGLIQVLASSYVGPKERIALVDVLGEKFLIGITSREINLLAKITDEEKICASPPSEPKGLFKSLLKLKINDITGASGKKVKDA